MSYTKFYNDPKFRTIALMGFSTLLLYFGGKYATPSIFDDIKVVWGVFEGMLGFILTQQFVAQAQSFRREITPSFFKSK